MSAGETSDKTGVRVRWLVAGAFSADPVGARWTVSAESYASVLESTKLTATVTVPDRVGAHATRAVTLGFATLKHFQTADLVSSVPVLRDLQALGAALVATDATRRISSDGAIARAMEIVGEGKLTATLRTKLGVGASPTATPAAPAAPPSGDAIDALLSQTGGATPGAVASASAIDRFVRASRESGGASAAPVAQGRAARDAIETEVYAMAADILRDPVVSKLEGAWRALKLLVEQCPASAGMTVDVMDCAGDLAAAVESALPTDPDEDLPDAVFVLDTVDTEEGLRGLSLVAEGANVPVLVSVGTGFFGVADAGLIASRIEEEDGALPAWWKVFRAEESSRWLSVVANRVVLRSEGTGAARRVLMGSPVAVVAAMLAASYHKSGAFARILGQPAALRSPGTWELPHGRDVGMVVPTEAFFSIRAQTRLAQLGVLGVGSARNGDSLILSAMPTVRAGEDVVPLSAQILTGRVVRFAQWTVGQVPVGASEDIVRALFEQGAMVFLFPSAADGAKVEAHVVSRETQRQVVLQVSVRADLAGIPFHLGFALPLRA